MRALLYVLLVVLCALRIDLWLWNDAQIVLGLPVGLTYHVLYCFAMTGVMALLVRYAWPAGVEGEE